MCFNTVLMKFEMFHVTQVIYVYKNSRMVSVRILLSAIVNDFNRKVIADINDKIYLTAIRLN